MSADKHTPMVVAAARALCKRGAEQCNVDFEDSWKVYGEDYLNDAQAALDAAGAPDLLDALRLAHAELHAMRAAVGPGVLTDKAIAAARAAFAKAIVSAP
jgi:hypothetical protein